MIFSKFFNFEKQFKWSLKKGHDILIIHRLGIGFCSDCCETTFDAFVSAVAGIKSAWVSGISEFDPPGVPIISDAKKKTY